MLITSIIIIIIVIIIIIIVIIIIITCVLTCQCTAYYGNLAIPVWRWEGEVEDWPVALLWQG